MTSGRPTASLATAVVVAAIGAGLVVSGSPERQREIRADRQRVADLSRLSSALSLHYRETRELPQSLEPLVNGRILTSLPRDPVSDLPYPYQRSGAARYRLCAQFARESTEPAGDFWQHAAGERCFAFDLTDIRLD
jgi:hypothetical protein